MYLNKREMIKQFNNEFDSGYIDFEKELYIRSKYKPVFDSIKLSKDYIKNKSYCSFIYNYNNINEYISFKNKKFIEYEINDSKNILDDINGISLSLDQRKAIITDEISSLIIAGAGCGKTLTIIGKIIYLVERKKIKGNEILCISFTNEATNSLKNKIRNNYNIDVFTFHKLGLNILQKFNQNTNICSIDYLTYIIDEYFWIIYDYPLVQKYILVYFDEYTLKRNIKFNYNNLIKKEKFKSFKILIKKFILLLKANNYDSKTLENFLNRNNKMFKYEKCYKNKIFLKIVFNIYSIYQSELLSTESVDFDDMLIKANEIVLNNKNFLNYKYIIIDEYQDTSLTRFNLIQSIIEKTKAKLIAVGDDYQSVYRFTGCDISLFLNFSKHFRKSEILKIENTYRNSQELINTAGNFIMKNNAQIKKKLKSDKNIDKPIKIIFYKNNFEKLLLYIYNKHKLPILILGRNNNDIHNYIDKSKFIINSDGKIIYIKQPKIDLRYLTVHKSKGLEEEITIIINLKNDILGFPNKIEDEKVLNLINKQKNYMFDEERRLFYVALTRTKNYTYLITQKNNMSIFVKEIIKDKNVEILKI